MNRALKTWLRLLLTGAIAATMVMVALRLGRRGASGVEAPASTRPAVPAGDGVVTGVVKFLGTLPPVQTFGEGECCPGAPPARDESVVVNFNGTLKNVVVSIKDGPNVVLPMHLQVDHNIDQKFCRYVPHVLAVHTDESFAVTSSDPVTHNIDIQATANPAENFTETTPGASHTVSFANPEFVHFKCDVHPWMSATVAVFDHPFFAVTGDDGTFRIPRLPPGNYTLVAWHETFGELRQPITISTTQPAAPPVTFEFKPQ